MTTENSNQAVMLGLTQHPRGSWLTIRQDDDRREARMTTEGGQDDDRGSGRYAGLR